MFHWLTCHLYASLLSLPLLLDSVLVTSGDDSSIILSGVADGKTILRLPAANSTNALSSPTSSPSASHVTSLAFSAGSRYLVAGGGSSSLRVFDLKHPDRTPRRLAGHVAEVLALDFGAQDATVASCSEAGEILIHSLAQSSLQTKLASDGLPLYDIQHSPHRNGVLAAVGEGGHVQVWDILTSTLSSTLKPGLTLGPGPLSALRFSTTSANLLAAVGGKRLCFFDVASKKCIRDIATDYPLTSLDYHSDGCSIAIGTAVGHILMYDIRAASKPTAKILNAHRGEVNAIKFEHTLTGKKATAAPATSTAASESSRPRADQSSVPSTTSSQALSSSSPPSISSSALTTIPATSSSTVPSSALSRTNVSMNSSNLSSFSNATAPAGVTSTPFHNLFPSHLPPPGISDAFSPLKSHPSSTSYGSASPLGNVTNTSSDSSTSTSNLRSSHMPPAHLTATFGTKLTTSSLQPTQSSTSSSSMTSHGFNLSNVLPPSSSSTLSPSTTLPSSPRSNFPTASSTTATLARSPSPSSSSSPMPASTKQLIPSPDRRSHRSNLADGFSNMSDNNFGTPSSPSSSSGVGGGFTNSSHGLNDYQVSLLKSMLDESLYSLRTEFRSHLNDMHMQMIKQFHLQQLEHQRQMDAMTAKLNETLAKLAAPRPFPFQDFY